jgi:hypothetical protein
MLNTLCASSVLLFDSVVNCLACSEPGEVFRITLTRLRSEWAGDVVYN